MKKDDVAELAPGCGRASTALAELRRVADELASGDTSVRGSLTGDPQVDAIIRPLNLMAEKLAYLDVFHDETQRILVQKAVLLDHAVDQALSVNEQIEAARRQLDRTVRDRTAELVALNEQLKQAKQEAEAASRAKSRFLASMSHELRTLLNSVIGFTNQLLKNKDGHLSDREIDFLRRVQSNGTHLLALVNDVLDLSKVEAGKLQIVVEPVSLAAVITDVMAQIEGTDQVRELTLRTLIPEDAVPVMADGHRLKQVLLNLLANAVKFTSQGSVTVKVLTDGCRPTRMEVINTGIGVPEDRLEAIFEPFSQGDDTTWRRYGGTGLGLALLRQTRVSTQHCWLRAHDENSDRGR